jgi:hypothetical protein
MFFFPSFNMWKEEAKGIIFYLFIYFFIVEWLRTGGQGFFIRIC